MRQSIEPDCIDRCLSGFDAVPMHPFLGMDASDESLAVLFDGVDALYYRDTISRRHAKLFGPDLAPWQIRHRESLDIQVLVVEIDERSELGVVLDMVERTRPWRCYD